MKYTKLIEKYLLGELVGDDLTSFLNQLKTNPDLNHEYYQYHRILEFVSRNELVINNIVSKLSDFEFDPEIATDIKTHKTDEPLTDDEKDLSEKIKEARNSFKHSSKKDKEE